MINNPFGSPMPAPPAPAVANPFAPQPLVPEPAGPRVPTHGNTQMQNNPMAQAIASPPPAGAVGSPFTVPRPVQMNPALGAPYGQQPASPFVGDPDDMKSEGQLVEEYIKARDDKSAMAKRHKNELEPLEDRMAEIERKMLARLQRSNVQSMNTDFGTAFQKTTTRFSIEDPEQFMSWVQAQNMDGMLKRDIRQDPVREYVEQTGQVPPGIKVFSQQVVQFRK